MKLILTGTGTSQGSPVINCQCEVCRSSDPHDHRLRTSAVLMNNDTTIAIDVSPDFRQQMLRHNINHIDAVLITHEHHDHIGGMDDLRPYFFQRKKPIDVFAGTPAIQAIRQKYAYAFEKNPYPGAPQFNLIRLPSKPFIIKSLKIETIFAMHGKMPVWGFRFGKTAYLTDIKTINKQEKSKLKGLDNLIVNAIHQEQHHSHLSLDEALQLIQELSPQKAFLTHISHKMGTCQSVKKKLPSNVFLGYDGLTIESD
ncbi:MAG: MBL fold metallo-hydrolase [Bacteroidota bacterium]